MWARWSWSPTAPSLNHASAHLCLPHGSAEVPSRCFIFQWWWAHQGVLLLGHLPPHSLTSSQITSLDLLPSLSLCARYLFIKCIGSVEDLIKMYGLEKNLQYWHMCMLGPELEPSILPENLSTRWNGQMSYFSNFVILFEQQPPPPANAQSRKYASLGIAVTSSHNCLYDRTHEVPSITLPAQVWFGPKQWDSGKIQRGRWKQSSWWNQEWHHRDTEAQFIIWKWDKS